MSEMNQKAFTDRCNKLTGLFLKKINEEMQDRNLVFSPFSILSMLSLLADATAGTTRQEITDLLYGGSMHQGFSEQLKALREVLTRQEMDYFYMREDEDPYFRRLICDSSEHFHTALAVFAKNSIQDSVSADFRKYLQETYNGEMLSSADCSAALKTWGPEMTMEMLQLAEEAANSDSLMDIINTVTFDAMWQCPYERKQIKKGVFHHSDHTESKVTMLYGYADSYVENEYGTGFVNDFQQCSYTFMVLLPKAEGPDGLRALVETTDFHHLMKNQKSAIVHTMMPEFSVSFKENLNGIIEKLGIREAFTEHADFSSISHAPLVADEMIHQAKIEVNRNGVKATAASELVLVGAGLPKDEIYIMIDRPFVFAIINTILDIPVFAGVVNQIEHKRTRKRARKEEL